MMKKIKNLVKILLTVMFILLLGTTMNAQTPQKVVFQTILSEQSLGDVITLNIIGTSISKVITLTTDNFNHENGLTIIKIGENSDLSTIDLSNSGILYVNIVYDNTIIRNVEVTSVFYALHAETASHISPKDSLIDGVDCKKIISNGQPLYVSNSDLIYNGGWLTYTQATGIDVGCPSLGEGWGIPDKYESQSICKKSDNLIGINTFAEYWTSEGLLIEMNGCKVVETTETQLRVRCVFTP